jgi:hypothetical protein
MLKVTFGNKKLPKNTLIFNIPARITCPGRTEFCEGKCYALKAERMYKQVLPARQSNFQASREASFIPDMIETISKARHKISQVRIHESGDFYNQKYLESWFSIAKTIPDLTFYAYTKSFHLNFNSRPDNFVLIASFDQTSRPINRLNYESKKKHFRNTFSIVGRHDKASCIQDCTICSACWTGKGKNITVNLH